MIRHDDVLGTGETRSELLIQKTSVNDNGTYFCQAQNKAATTISNFTLHVTNSVDSPTILQVKLRSSKSSVRSTAAGHVGHVGQSSSSHVARSVAAIWTLILFK